MNSEPVQSQSRPAGVPEGYEQVLFWTVTGQLARLIALQFAGAVLFLLFLFFFTWVGLRVADLPSNFSFNFGTSQCYVLAVGIPVTLVLHELVHGLLMQAFGARPQYGVMPKYLMFYATSPGYAFPRNGYLLIALGPLVVLSLLAVLLMMLLKGTDWVTLMVVLASVNASGAVGDMWISWIVSRFPASAFVVDEKDGMRIWARRQGNVQA